MKRLYRSSKNRMIAGVCGGIAEYFNVDVIVVRLIWLLLVLMGGPGIIAYIVAWIVIPPEPTEKAQSAEGTAGAEQPPEETAASTEAVEPRTGSKSSRTGEVVVAILLICFGGYFLLRQFMPHRWLMWLSWGKWWPLLIIAAGIGLLLRSGK
ncbi:MAG: PspC domain-containing protein [Bacillota bacterium]